MCSDIMVLLRTGNSSEDLDWETLASIMEHIHLLESEIVARNERLQPQAMLHDVPPQHERDLAMQDLENHKSIFAPIRRLPNDVLLRIFQMSTGVGVKPDVKTIPWVLGYVCHHWRALSRSSHSLWTDICLASLRYSNLSSGQRSLRNRLLSLSGDSPLKITINMINPFKADIPHRPVFPSDDRDRILEDITRHSHRYSRITLIIGGPVSTAQNFSCRLPLLRSLFLAVFDINNPRICRLFSSAPLLQDVNFVGPIVMWREFARVVSLSQLVRLTVHDDIMPDFYACVKETTALEDLYFRISHLEDQVVQPSTPGSNAQLLPTFVHNNIQKLVLDGKLLCILDRFSIPNLKELLICSKLGEDHLVRPEVESPDLGVGVGHLLRFLKGSECNLQAFHCFIPIPLSALRSLWKQWLSSLTRLTITITLPTQGDVVRELTFQEGEPGVLPNLQLLRLRTPDGVSIFEDDSLLKMVLSRLARCPGSFTTQDND
ncbi:uncharacterized protein EV420DRAFT_241876 [Desarmillaria tabescens]|uniref:F-box domain-containing protein n=1 Tax=Armillaria tabescens TaxID=1929756 RepID=A0AA39J6S9_ARMTA|nr:uncharacterized protein EV420DRAFT_241876 [Desarmillaria tabescens]KAK0436301.1 hypothetical protein EV420DRAFT_241876 [Desarmillaria tabescens]